MIKIRSYLSTTALALVLATPVAATTGGEAGPFLTLEDGIAIALEQNHLLGAASAGLEAAEQEARAAAAHHQPVVELMETFSRTTNPTYVFSNKLGQENFTPDDFDPVRLNTPDALNNWNTMLAVDQPIWTGGKIKAGKLAARYGRDATAARRERTRQEVVFQVIETYTGAVLARRHLEVAREALATARAHVKLVADMREAGMVVESDLLQARVRESEVEEMVYRAESAVAVAHAAVNLALGRDLDTPFRLPEDLDVGEPGADSVEDLTAEAAENRPDLQAAGNQVLAAERMIKVSKSDWMPEIGARGLLEANAEDFVGADGTNWSVFVGLKWTVYDGKGRKARIRQAGAKATEARRMRDLLQQSVGLEVRQAYYDLEAARKRLDQAEKAVEMSRVSLGIVEDRYKEGLATLVELRDAETSLTRARTREVGARRDILMSGATLELAVGRL